MGDQQHGDKEQPSLIYRLHNWCNEKHGADIVDEAQHLMSEAAEALTARSAGTRIAPPHLTEMFCLNLAVCVEGGIEVSQAARDGLLKKLTDLREWCKTPHSASERTSAEVEEIARRVVGEHAMHLIAAMRRADEDGGGYNGMNLVALLQLFYRALNNPSDRRKTWDEK